MTASEQKIVKRACKIIFSNEGNYGSVNKNDNGALSVGKVQWHAGRALSLMRDIVAKDESAATKILGLTMVNEIKNQNTDWSKRTVSAGEAGRMTQLLQTDIGKKLQDELAEADVYSYLKVGMKYGLTDENALIYFCDGVNQYGTYSTLWKNIASAALKKGGDLDAIYEATVANTSNYLTRRKKVYDTLKATTGKQTTIAKPVYKNDTILNKRIQRWLNAYAYCGLTVDGIIGPKTKAAAIRALQHSLNCEYACKLNVDGLFGPLTKAACSKIILKKGSRGDLVSVVQTLLYNCGINPNGFDGIFGNGMLTAIRYIQEVNKMTVDGICRGNVVLALIQ